MSHQLLAAVWEQLGRHDVANIIREIIGQHAIDLAIQWQDGLSSNIDQLMDAVCWIKVVFDLQRTYLQGRAGAADCDPFLIRYLVPSDLIFSTLMYLIQVKSRLFSNMTAVILVYSKYRYFISKTLLSGIRVLLLRNEPLSSEKKYNLERAIYAAWKGQQPNLSPAERHLLTVVLREAIDRIPTAEAVGDRLHSDRQLWLSFLDRAGIPSYTAGLYPFSIVPGKLMPGIFEYLEENNRDWIASFWTIFDIIWASESSLIQCHVDRRYTREHGSASKAAAVLESVEEDRRKLVIAILKPLSASHAPFVRCTLENLAHTLLRWDYGDAAPLPVPDECWSHLNDANKVLDASTGHFVAWLINRRIQLWDCNGELETVSQEYHRNLRSWMQTAALPKSESPCHQSTRRNVPIYVVDCPSLHPVPRDLLEEKMRANDARGYEELRRNVKLLQVNISCPLCSSETRVRCARMLEPLEQLSNALHRRTDSGASSRPQASRTPGSGDTTSRSDALSHSTSCSSSHFDPIEPPKTKSLARATSYPASPPSDAAATTDGIIPPVPSPVPADHVLRSPVWGGEKGGPTRDFKSFRMALSKKGTTSKVKPLKVTPLPNKPRFSFSTSGNSLVLWGDDINWVMKFDISISNGEVAEMQKYEVSGVDCAVVGNRRCAIVTSAGEQSELVVFDHPDTPESRVSIEPKPRKRHKICMAMSRNDKYVALSFDDYVYVYQVNMGKIRRVHLLDEMEAYHVHRNEAQATLLGPTKKSLNWREILQEAQRQSTSIERKLSFSPNSKKMIIASHLADHHVYLDVWDCENEPWAIRQGHSRSFKLPPWTTNDGDLTCVFYDPLHRSAFVTAFLGKEYPVLIPIPGYGHLDIEEKSTKILHAAQSPSGSRFAIVNSVTEIHVYNYKPDGTLNNRKLKKCSKLPSSSFKLGHMIVSIPQENTLLVFWIKEMKLMLRKIKIDDETYSDYDLRSDYEDLTVERPSFPPSSSGDSRRPSFPTTSPSTQIPPSSYFISELPAPLVAELPAFPSIDEMSSIPPLAIRVRRADHQ